MKKIVMGICGLIMFCWGVASLRSGALKADDLPQEPVIETTVPESSTVVEEPAPPVSEGPSAATVPETPVAPVTPAAPEVPVAETPVEVPAAGVPAEVPVEDSTPEVPVEVPTTPETGAPAETTVPTENSTGDSTATTSSSDDSSNSGGSTSDSSTSQGSTSDSSTSQSSTDQSSTNPTSDTGTSSSAGSTSGGTLPSDSSSSWTQPSSTAPSSSYDEPKQSTVPAAPQETPPKTNSVSAQASSAFTPAAPEAFSQSSTLDLPSELKTSEVAQSDLKGFELPLLSSFKDKAHAALVYDGIKKLGTEQADNFSPEQLATELYHNLFGIELSGTPEKLKEEISIGSLLYQKKKEKNELVGIYIGEDYYLTVGDVEVEQAEKDTEVAKTSDDKEAAGDSAGKTKQRQVILQPMDLDEDILVQPLPTVTLTEYGNEVLAEYPASINFTENEGAKNFIAKIAEDARQLGQEYDVFASVMIAQALLESGSGTSSLSLPPNHNLFGVKGSYQGQVVSMATQEDRGNGALYSINAAFRKYPNYAASLGDYVQLLRGGISGNAGYYQKTWRSTAKNYLRTTNALTGTYATDISYGRKLNSIIAVYNLTQYDRVKVDQTAGVFIKGKEEIPEAYRSLMRYPDYNGVNYNTSGSYPVGQCTWYAFNRVKQLGKSVDDFMGNGGEWGTKGKALGYEVSREPKAGWLISFKPGVAGSDARYGHVAFVEVVKPEGILISEGNVYGGTVISYRVIDANLAKSDLVTYIKAK
ncbi:glucosaminidase domain-containing protein [Enterococcus devriesei]|uniref:glucosaminidase domain-containing protein n=1 Tax=Enterococcus devriesei TaxID=319970 RepID=UPI001C0FFA92|nr:glucosaminidase domain-containing protein [Enterococcus devriesei]MBU5366142.1 glucosaminidase domain-containing protein [Enterococcus devriesei]